MKTLLGALTAAATLSLGLAGAAPASADHLPAFLTDGGKTCVLDQRWFTGLYASTTKVSGVQPAEVLPGDVAPDAVSAYTCRFSGLPSFIPAEQNESGEAYVGPTRGPRTSSILCYTGYDPMFIEGTLKVFKNGTALLQCKGSAG